jgi:hypothetical protein
MDGVMDGPGLGIGVFVFLFGSALAGVLAHARMPPGTLTGRTTLAIGHGGAVVAVLAALTLTLMTVHVKSQFDGLHRDVGQFSAQLTELDHVLRQLGPDGAPARELLFSYGAQTLKDIWPDTRPRLGPDGARPPELLHRLEDRVAAIHPSNPERQELAARARQSMQALVDASWGLDPESGHLLSPWLTAALVFWLMLTFAAFGLVAPRTKLVLTMLGLCAAALAVGVFVLADYASAFGGVIYVSSDPLENALFVMSGQN